MEINTTKPFDSDYERLPNQVKDLADRKFKLLLLNPRHPSLRIKKMEDPRDIWEASISKNYRFTFQLKENTYILRRIGTHDILRNP